MRKILKEQNGLTLIQQEDQLFVFQSHNIDVNDISSLDLSSDDIDCEAQVKALPDNKIQIISLQELYQFNCCNSIQTTISLLNYGLKHLGQTYEVEMSNPESFSTRGFSNFQISLNQTVKHENYPHPIRYDVIYSFEYKGTQISGTTHFSKYTFFNDIETLPQSLPELFELYVDLNKIVSLASSIGKDTMYLSCDDWAIPVKFRK